MDDGVTPIAASDASTDPADASPPGSRPGRTLEKASRRHGGVGDSSLQPGPPASLSKGLSRTPFRHYHDGYRRLPAALLDRESGPVFDLRFGTRPPAGP